MTNITLQQIEIFLTVAEQLNLTEAAKDLFINQSAVSRWIHRLEGSLHTTLFVRNNRGVELTPDGVFLYAELKPIYSRLSTTLRSMRSLYDMPQPIIRVGYLESDEIVEILKNLVEMFEVTHPDVMIRLEPFDFKDLRENLVLGNIDCAITYYLGFGEYHTLKSKKIKKLASYFAISARHPLAAFDTLPAERLADENLFLLTLAEMRGPEERALGMCRDNGFTPKEIIYLPSFLALEMAVRSMRGICINGPNFGRRFGSDIKLYEIAGARPEQYIIVAWHEGRCPEIAKQFIDVIHDTTEENI
jgi:DNA-binding transcriptional LysR family regulator